MFLDSAWLDGTGLLEGKGPWVKSAGMAVLSYRSGHYGNGPKVKWNCSKVKRKENSNALYLSVTLNICNFSVSIFSCQIVCGPVFVSHPPKQINTILLCSAWLLKLHSPSDRRPELCLLVCLLEYWMHVVQSTSRQDVTSILDRLLWIVLQWIILFFSLTFILPRFHC